jgi:hypothetical protein
MIHEDGSLLTGSGLCVLLRGHAATIFDRNRSQGAWCSSERLGGNASQLQIGELRLQHLPWMEPKSEIPNPKSKTGREGVNPLRSHD